MKSLLTALVFILSLQSSHGQACGIYRIQYAGMIKSGSSEIISLRLPTTVWLHGLENDSSTLSYIDTKPVNGIFNYQIGSHLTTPFNDAHALLAYYKTQRPGLVIKVTILENKVLKERNVEIPWEDIAVSIIEDHKFGTLFLFKIKEIVI